MKKIFLIVLSILLVAGCGSKNENSKYSNEDFSYKNIQLGYDAEPYFDLFFSKIASSESGYYYYDYSHRYAKKPSFDIYLMFFDRESKKAVPVCTKADCKHILGDDCDALFNPMNNSNSVASVLRLWFYDGYLYSVILEREGSICLYRISTDGSVRTKYATIFENGVDGSYNMICHRGYIYISLSESNKESLYKLKLEKDAKLEPVYEQACENNEIWFGELTPYKKGITFSVNYYNETGDTISGCDIMYYNPETEQVSKIIEGLKFESYLIDGAKFYYAQNGDIYIYNIDSKENRLFYSCGYPVYISYDGTYIYAERCQVLLKDYSEHYIYVIDTEGSLVDTIQAPAGQDCYFGDKDYLFQMFDLNETLKGKSDMPVIKAFDKSQIGTGLHEWIELPTPQG